VTEEALETCVGEVMRRERDLAGTPPPASEPEVRALYEAAY
jgi:hypothetical protein